MLTKRIIPCLDIKNGRTVKGVNFLDLKDAGDPVELAKKYAETGADELVFLDISATEERRATLIDLVRKVAAAVNIPFIQNYQKEGIQYVICTDISKDGMLEGPSFELYQRILEQTKDAKLIASGGISTFDELPKLAELGCEGTIIGKAIYGGRITLEQLENYIINK